MARRYRPKFERLTISDSKLSDDSFYPLSMTTDRRTEQYVKFAKVMIIFQGPVTNERTRAVIKLGETFRNSGRLLSDDTYKEQKVMKTYSEEHVNDFYAYFRNWVKKACEEIMNIIIIDQSMTDIRQMKYFVSLAQTRQYVILPYPPLVDVDSSRQNTRNTFASQFSGCTGTPVEIVNYFKHLFCGWFLHDVDSHELRMEANLYIRDCFDNIPDFKEMFSTVCVNCDFKEYYNMVDRYQDLAYCVTKIFQNPLDTISYMSSQAFKKFYGGMTRLYIVGFIISPHIIAARIKLTRDQRVLWEMPDELELNKVPSEFPSQLLSSSKIPNEEKVQYRGVKSNRTIDVGDPIEHPTGVFHPNAAGRASHIVLGHADNAPLPNLNYDVQLALFREKRAVQNYSHEVRPYDLDRSQVRRIGKYWLIYLKETMVINGLFSTCAAVERR